MHFSSDIIFLVLLIVTCLLCLLANFALASGLQVVHAVWGRKTGQQPCQPGSFTIIVPAYNEEKNIAQKIATLRQALLHVTVPVEVIIGSDGSTDRTAQVVAEILQQFDSANWRVVEFPNEGKCKTLNKLVGFASGEIIISTDADIPLPENSLELVVQAFQSNGRLGCLSCVPCFEELNIGNQKAYWSIEDQIRRAESRLGKLIVVTGMLYAYRKDLFAEIPDGVMADDLWIPLNVLLQGYESSQSDQLRIPYEKTDEETEILRRKRVIVGGMDVVRRLGPSLAKEPFLLLLVLLHKVNRWSLPVWLLLLVLATVLLWPWFLLIYAALGLLGVALLGAKKCRKLAYAGFSPILSFAEVLGNKDFARWEHTRKS